MFADTGTENGGSNHDCQHVTGKDKAKDRNWAWMSGEDDQGRGEA
jgi:hypothetical protein